MIAALRGIVEERGPTWLLLRVGGVSLQVSVPAPTLAAMGPAQEEVRLHTHLHVREDTLALYGFLTAQERDVFVLLLGVAGIGPRGALSILSTLGPGELAGAVKREDKEALQRAPGVGARTADRILVELKGKLEFVLAAAPGLPGAEGRDEVLDALLALGYTPSEARRTLASLGELGGAPLEERVRQALQALGRR